MSNSQHFRFVALVVLVMAFGATGTVAQQYAGPKCLGPVCIGGKTTFQGLTEQLGGPSSSGGIYGYRTADGKNFLIITEGGQGAVGSIDLRDFSEFGMWTAKDGKVTTQDLRNWKTSDGIGLGSPEADVLKAYGKPSGVQNLELEDASNQKGKKVLLYKGALNGLNRAARFRIRDGKVSFIELDANAFIGPDCLGPFCTYGDVSLGSLLRHLGLPAQKIAPQQECFQSQDSRASLHFATDVEETSGIADVLLSEFPNCMHRRKGITTRDLHGWKTPEGIGLGSSEDEVVKAYGQPTTIKKLDMQKPVVEVKGLLAGYRAGDTRPQVGEKVLIYGPRELQQVDFGIRDGKVSYIWLKESDFWLTGEK
jgi:hypothetical protein